MIGLVVQPGVEFDHTGVIDYQPEKAIELSQVVDQYPQMVFEAHSTDYQTDKAYCQLVADHFAILKVGPALTFAMREALFNLAAIEDELVASAHSSHFKQCIENQMREHPQYWQKYYHGNESQQRFLVAIVLVTVSVITGLMKQFYRLKPLFQTCLVIAFLCRY